MGSRLCPRTKVEPERRLLSPRSVRSEARTPSPAVRVVAARSTELAPPWHPTSSPISSSICGDERTRNKKEFGGFEETLRRPVERFAELALGAVGSPTDESFRNPLDLHSMEGEILTRRSTPLVVA